MSTAIWDSGDLVASVCAVKCDRCNTLGRCVQVSTNGQHIIVCINICVRCFGQLAAAIGWQDIANLEHQLRGCRESLSSANYRLDQIAIERAKEVKITNDR